MTSRKLSNIIQSIPGTTCIKIRQNYRYSSGFFTYSTPSGEPRIFYVSHSDDMPGDILVRTADSYSDYTGGSNRYAKATAEHAHIKAMPNNTENRVIAQYIINALNLPVQVAQLY